MANILQVTNNPVTNDRTIPDNQKIGNYEKDPQIRNPADPSRVVRADGQETGNTRDAAAGNSYSIIDFESNFGAFVKKLGEGTQSSELLQRLFTGENIELLFGRAEAGELADELLASIRLETPEELLAFLKGQQAAQTKFSGSFFDGLRNILKQDTPDSLKDTVLSFLKAYNDYSSGEHFLQQMRSITEDIGRLIFRGYRDEFSQLLEAMDWTAENGDTAANAALLNDRLIPFLSSYISQTHDYGAVRNAVMLFVFHAVRYENGNLDQLRQLYDRMTGNREFERFYKPEGQAGLMNLLESLRQTGEGKGFADAFASLLLKGTNGEAGLENIQQFYNALDGMLLNESVYMPVLHMLVPFSYQDKNVMSEMWIDPDSGKEGDSRGRKIKMLLKFGIQELGDFELLLSLQDRSVDMQLNVPEALLGNQDTIQEQVAGIFKKNGMGVGRFQIKERKGSMRVEDAFPEIKERGRSINVRI